MSDVFPEEPIGDLASPAESTEALEQAFPGSEVTPYPLAEAYPSVLNPAVTANLPATVQPDWEVVLNDNGDVIEFQPNDVYEGYFVDLQLIELTPQQIEEARKQNPDDDRTSAELLIFQQEDGERFCCWPTTQLKASAFKQGDWYRIECKGERRTRLGRDMKTFRVARDRNRHYAFDIS